MLDDIERWRLLVKPPGEDALIAAVALPHVELDEGASELLNLPGRRGLAGAQPDDHIADPRRLARPQGEITRQAVALVEQADDRDALGHRCRAGGEAGDGLRNVHRLSRGIAVGRIALRRAARAAGGERKHGRHRNKREAADHAPSGVQA